MALATHFAFPNPVNERAARVVAASVAVTGVVIIATQWWWLTIALAIGFLARVLAGPRWSVVGRLAAQVIAPRLGPPVPVPGPPKRFAQAVGLTFSTAAAIATLTGATAVGIALLATLVAFATLESVFRFCAGCWVFGRLMALGVIPETTCDACRNWSPARRPAH